MRSYLIQKKTKQKYVDFHQFLRKNEEEVIYTDDITFFLCTVHSMKWFVHGNIFEMISMLILGGKLQCLPYLLVHVIFYQCYIVAQRSISSSINKTLVILTLGFNI